jgi:hypothetical protein
VTTISASLDTAYARQCGYAYDGLPVPDNDDSIPSFLEVFPEFCETGFVVTNVGETPVRLELTPVQARQYAIALVHSAEVAEAGHLCAPAEGECCGHAIPIAAQDGAA